MSEFLTELDFKISPSNENVFILKAPLVYYSSLLGREITARDGFNTDLASVPRIPIIYELWGNRAHYEAVIHDLLFRKDSEPVVPFMTANRVFLEAMECRGKPYRIRYPMFWGVCIGAYPAYHKRRVADVL